MQNTYDAVLYYARAEQFHHQCNFKQHLPLIDAARNVHHHFCNVAKMLPPEHIGYIQQLMQRAPCLVPWTFDAAFDPCPPDDGSFFKVWEPAPRHYALMWAIDFPVFDDWVTMLKLPQK